jgi:hypothetical protein
MNVTIQRFERLESATEGLDDALMQLTKTFTASDDARHLAWRDLTMLEWEIACLKADLYFLLRRGPQA